MKQCQLQQAYINTETILCQEGETTKVEMNK